MQSGMTFPRLMLLFPVVLALQVVTVSGAPPASAKRFQSGVSGLGYQWNLCREGDIVHYVVFANGPRPREMGDDKAGPWVDVSGAGSRNPQARLRLRFQEQRDLLAAPERIYQIHKGGQVTTYDERVTSAELSAFMGSYPKQYTAQALLDYVHQLRNAAR